MDEATLLKRKKALHIVGDVSQYNYTHTHTHTLTHINVPLYSHLLSSIYSPLVDNELKKEEWGRNQSTSIK